MMKDEWQEDSLLRIVSDLADVSSSDRASARVRVRAHAALRLRRRRSRWPSTAVRAVAAGALAVMSAAYLGSAITQALEAFRRL